MTGTLELLCGPSGVGKTVYIPIGTQQFRWTTRPKRASEINSKEWDGTATTHGYFVTKEEFFQAADKGELIGVHSYPLRDRYIPRCVRNCRPTVQPDMIEFTTKYTQWYGFPQREMYTALKDGRELYEQIVNLEAIRHVNHHLRPVTNTFICGFESDIRNNIERREGDLEQQHMRILQIRKELLQYCQNLDMFNKIYFNLPCATSFNEAMPGAMLMLDTLEKNYTRIVSDISCIDGDLGVSLGDMYQKSLTDVRDMKSLFEHGGDYQLPLPVYYGLVLDLQNTINQLCRGAGFPHDITHDKKVREVLEQCQDEHKDSIYFDSNLSRAYAYIAVLEEFIDGHRLDIPVFAYEGRSLSQTAIKPFIPFLMSTVMRQMNLDARSYLEGYLQSFRKFHNYFAGPPAGIDVPQPDVGGYLDLLLLETHDAFPVEQLTPILNMLQECFVDEMDRGCLQKVEA